MSIVTKEFQNPFLEEGKEQERKTIECLYKEYGGIFERVSTYIDKRCHIDFIWCGDDKVLRSADSKGLKKFHQSKNEPFMKNHTWVELTGVYGHPGWMYSNYELLNKSYHTNKFTEKEDYIVFESPEDFILVSREVLPKFINEKYDESKLVENFYDVAYASDDTLNYMLHKRNSLREDGTRNKDVIMLVPFSDLRKISTKIIKK